jgi:chorismate mutase/prephenate dehydratase
MKVAYFGREGSYAHQVAVERFGKSAAYVACPTHGQVVEALLARRVPVGVLPLENSIAGVVMETIDTLVTPQFARSPVKIREHLDMCPQLALLARSPSGSISAKNGKATALRKIRRLYSHGYPIRYLARWIRQHLPQAEVFETVSTSEAAQLASEQPNTAAIAGIQTARIYGLEVLHPRLNRAREYVTRFCVVSSRALSRTPPTHAALCFGLHHRPGSLVTALTVLSQHHLNLTRIISRPLIYRTGKFEPNTYLFWVDIDIGKSRPSLECALNQLRRATTFMDILGMYSIRG